MTLQEFRKKANFHMVFSNFGGCIAYPKLRDREELFHLDNYVVSMVAGPCVWLVRKINNENLSK